MPADYCYNSWRFTTGENVPPQLAASTVGVFITIFYYSKCCHVVGMSKWIFTTMPVSVYPVQDRLLAIATGHPTAARPRQAAPILQPPLSPAKTRAPTPKLGELGSSKGTVRGLQYIGGSQKHGNLNTIQQQPAQERTHVLLCLLMYCCS